MNLFQHGAFTLASGQESNFKIDCDALTPDDWACLAQLVAGRVQSFAAVIGVPQGGLALAEALASYCEGDKRILIVDDVFTTGGSIERVRSDLMWWPKLTTRGPDDDVIGAVVFARAPTPGWITPLFSLTAVE